ncbi:MAG: glycogen/starch/alpha-glucan phosphorylase [Chloroflexi bacterium]|nr:glycogen/starch/alpha-glucan phosphorylase [Chloroflexota bacterium]
MQLANYDVSARDVRTVGDFKQAFLDHLNYTRGQDLQTASVNDMYFAIAYTVRDYLMHRRSQTMAAYYAANPKVIYYLSAEYLLGRQLSQNLLYTDTLDLARQAMTELGLDLDRLIAEDPEPGLGNGGLGRLAACFLDSLATLDIPCIGYGIRYEFGMFKQSFEDGWQVESPDDWLYYGNPWEFPQADDMVTVGLGGRTETYTDDQGNFRVRWLPTQTVLGEPYHTIVPGFRTRTVNILRLWRAHASEEFEFKLFDIGDYARAVAQKVYSENISKVLYPNDNTPQGESLRLQQQYFFVACSLRDIIRRFLVQNNDWDQFPNKVAIQLNDTHPVVAIPEMMRLLLDDYGLSWDRAWTITINTFSSTQHTLLPEALETWRIDLFGSLLPRHLEIIYEINHRFLDDVRAKFPGDEYRVQSMSIIGEGGQRQVRMANLACVGSHSINGVAELQSKLLRERVLRDFAEMYPERFNNKTNGVTPRRFMRLANPRLADLITSRIGDGWLTDLEQLRGLESHVQQPDFRQAWREVKHQNKIDLANHIGTTLGIAINPDSIFDIMVKRLHEYKRQLLKTLHIITLYNRIKANPDVDLLPRTFIFGAKAAPGYHAAKMIIKLINAVGAVVNHDPDVRERLKVVFLPNFNVSLGELIYPAANLSEQISMAGKEASGTGNMKFALNGALTVGTLDGANIEIRDRVGAENFFLFGLTADEVFATKANGYNPSDYYHSNLELRGVIDRIASGDFAGGDPGRFREIVDTLRYRDEYLLMADYQAYIEVQDRVDAAYRDVERWTEMSILNTARCGFFSSDRSMQQYSDEIWRVTPVRVNP